MESKTPRTDAIVNDYEHLPLTANMRVWHLCRQLENELADKDKQLAEARARIDHLERIVDEMTEEQAALCAEDQSITELVAAKDKQLAEAQAEIERRDTLLEKCLSLLKQQKERGE